MCSIQVLQKEPELEREKWRKQSGEGRKAALSKTKRFVLENQRLNWTLWVLGELSWAWVCLWWWLLGISFQGVFCKWGRGPSFRAIKTQCSERTNIKLIGRHRVHFPEAVWSSAAFPCIPACYWRLVRCQRAAWNRPPGLAEESWDWLCSSVFVGEHISISPYYQRCILNSALTKCWWQ